MLPRAINAPGTFLFFIALANLRSLANPPIPPTVATVAKPSRTSPLSNAWYAVYILPTAPTIPASAARIGPATLTASARSLIFPAPYWNPTFAAATIIGGAPASIATALIIGIIGARSWATSPQPDLLYWLTGTTTVPPFPSETGSRLYLLYPSPWLSEAKETGIILVGSFLL